MAVRDTCKGLPFLVYNWTQWVNIWLSMIYIRHNYKCYYLTSVEKKVQISIFLAFFSAWDIIDILAQNSTADRKLMSKFFHMKLFNKTVLVIIKRNSYFKKLKLT